MKYEVGQSNRLGNRSQNEDRSAIIETPEGVLLVLADGMGGHESGEIAAETLVEVVSRHYRQARRPLNDPGRFFRHAFLDAHQVLLDLAQRNTYESYPGTTAVACVIENGQMHSAHVGDSRLYIFRNGLPIFRTRDHSYVEQLYQRGMISLSEQSSHPQRNQITQCIGCQIQDPTIELGKSRVLAEGDLVLLCSDGLWEALDDAQMGALLQNSDGNLGGMVDHLAGTAEQAAYPNSDNISVIALRFYERSACSGGNGGDDRPSGPQSGERLKDAIDAIEQVLKEYENEFKS